MVRENVSYQSFVRSLEILFTRICFAKERFEDFQTEVKLLHLDVSSVLVSVDEQNFPTGFVTIKRRIKDGRGGISNNDYPGGVFDIDCFAAEANRGQGLARKLTIATEDYLEQKGEQLMLMFIELTIPKPLKEYNKMQQMLTDIGFESTRERFFTKQVTGSNVVH